MMIKSVRMFRLTRRCRAAFASATIFGSDGRYPVVGEVGEVGVLSVCCVGW
jgi:hypothetical protein